ncbi:flagellar biosynthetic protein FliO [Desulfovibrio sp. JC010]|uniref:flagellar biosynthetic protein FliO n=1 Tax=Desulfovibrio sp. JC010 TaxID=2593641 RepID=UPI0013CFE78E|nr:flagellar biosynthetic protein FliO [Desulfovibrio sp. JC010]NDV26223.1 flagellar biosynthetic protein FliO [Desulfovibrio sp. JC010]
MPNATATALMVPETGLGSVLKMSGALFFILAMLLLAYYFMRRLNIGGAFPGARKGTLEIVDRLALGPRQNITVIRYRDKELVVGVTHDKITMLHAGDEGNAKTDSDFAGYLEKEHSGTSDS